MRRVEIRALSCNFNDTVAKLDTKHDTLIFFSLPGNVMCLSPIAFSKDLPPFRWDPRAGRRVRASVHSKARAGSRQQRRLQQKPQKKKKEKVPGHSHRGLVLFSGPDPLIP